MLVDFSHILTFSMLFIAAVFDVRSELGDVPDVFPAAAVVGGIVLHAAQAYIIGSWQPLLYSLGVGAVFSVYGWAAYWKGMWGGADAFALSALGFGAPYLTLSLPGVVRHSTSLFINIVLVAFIYTLVFSVVRAFRKEGFFSELVERFKGFRKEISLVAGFGLVAFGIFDPIYALGVYTLILLSTFTFLFLKTVEEYAMVEKVDADELNGGEVLKGDRIRGVTAEEAKELNGEVEVVHGLRFLPVFPIALLLTDAGLTLIQYFLSV
ncbi:MAG: hypothetical protein ABEK16_04415 [Candidatus Nanohalobium sp.]